jgi:hypothetical protein
MIKFNLNQLVKPLGKPDTDAGKVISISITNDGIFYKVVSRELDMARKEIITGVSTYAETELEAVNEKI